MATIELFGRINDKGELEINLPHGLHAGSEVKVTITEPDKEVQAEHWGKSILALRDQLDMSDWENMEGADDVVEWLRKQREDEEKHRRANWDIE
jgi:hypothetical protein